MELKFVSENDLETARKRRQEEWEKVRKPDDPEEAPEEEYDPRSLFERLQEQKMRKQEEFEESRRLKNLVKGLDDDELSFLDVVDQLKMDIEISRLEEEKEAIEEFRKAICHSTNEERGKMIEKFRTSFAVKPRKVKINHNPLANLIKRQIKEENKDIPSQSKKQKVDDKSEPDKGSNRGTIAEPSASTQIKEEFSSGKQRSGLVAYDSDSDELSHDEDADKHSQTDKI